MLRMDFVIDDDVLVGDGDVSDAPVDHRVVRDPEIVWLADVQSDDSDGDVRSIPELLAEVEAALNRFDLGQAEDVCWKAWSLSHEAHALELANAIELLAFALDSNAQLSQGAREEQTVLLQAVRTCFMDTPAVRDLSAERAA